jgi:hypothetical protein
MTQTAVEWLIDMHFGGIEHVTPYFKKHIEQAKEMEKERIIQAYQQGVTDEHGDTITFTTEGEDYYNTL